VTKPRSSLKPPRWALQDAKNRFSEVVDAALRGQPQVVTRRGVETAVVISHDEYTRMTAVHAERRQSIAEYLLDGPTVDGGDAFERIKLRPRARS
jgi:antitoxin Phd